RRLISSIGLVMALGATGAGPALAQTGGTQVRITQVDNSRFPQVTVYVSVTDAAGQPVGVDPASIQISENGQAMQPTNLSGGGQGGVGPLTTILVMDISGSMDKDGKIDGAKSAAKAYVDQMRPGDQAGLMTYNTKYQYVQQLTQDHDALKGAIDAIQTGGDTAMYDALFAAEEILRDVQGRKAIIAVTDGLDNSSSHHADDIVSGIGPSGLSISTIGLGDPSTKEQRGLDEAGLQGLAQKAGGGYSFAGDATALSALFQRYGRALQNEYAITYTSPFTLRDGVNRGLTVSIAGAGATVQSKYNPGGVLPEVTGHSWVLFGGLLLALLALLAVPALLNMGGHAIGGGRKRSRIKLVGAAGPSSSTAAPPLARGRIKMK
ncbi:MAG TPA: VWA domain-containing protein, partial [Anaerolineales bacterium]|nr:VWA domain-containing protein [Anaerolineales bacterium]